MMWGWVCQKTDFSVFGRKQFSKAVLGQIQRNRCQETIFEGVGGKWFPHEHKTGDKT